MYSLYAFGVPVLLTLMVVSMDYLSFIPDAWQPKMGIERCWLRSMTKGLTLLNFLIQFLFISRFPYNRVRLCISSHINNPVHQCHSLFNNCIQNIPSAKGNICYSQWRQSQAYWKWRWHRQVIKRLSSSFFDNSEIIFLLHFRFFLYLRLFIVMGATWTMESISWIFENSVLFYITDILNCLQGFIIFILFVWKPKVKTLIQRR